MNQRREPPRVPTLAETVDIEDVLSRHGWPRERAWIGSRHVVGVDEAGHVIVGKVATTVVRKTPELVAAVELSPTEARALFDFLRRHMPPGGF